MTYRHFSPNALTQTHKEMNLSDFMNHAEARKIGDDYEVVITLWDGKPVVLTIENCASEFEAKERAYLYLVELIKNNQGQ